MGDYYSILERSTFLLLPVRLKLSNHCSIRVTSWLVPRPVGYLTITGAISCASASTTILCFAAVRFLLPGILHCGFQQSPIFVICFTSSYFSSKQEQGIRCRKNFTSVCKSAPNISSIFGQWLGLAFASSQMQCIARNISQTQDVPGIIITSY